jgi:hypothetical protein
MGYYLIACGTKDYDHYNNLPSVQDDLDRVVELFTKSFGYKRILEDKLNINPTREDIAKEFTNWLKEHPDEDSIVVFYYSGHGEACINTNDHYLVLKDTHPDTFRDTALPTKNLAHPLENNEKKISQILYIIDTCFAQAGSVELTRFIEQVTLESKKRNKTIDVRVMAACREKQYAKENVFSNILKETLENWKPEYTVSGHIVIEILIELINGKIKILNYSYQTVNHNCSSSNGLGRFFPIVPRNLQEWGEKSSELIDKLCDLLKKNHDHSLYLINSFFLANRLSEKFASNGRELRQRLDSLAKKPVLDQVCYLIAYSEWCIVISESMENWTQEIDNWQREAINHRPDADISTINSYVEEMRCEFENIINNDQVRIQIQIVPKQNNGYWDGDNTGLLIKNEYLLNVNLWIRSRNFPLGHFARSIDVFLENIESEISTIIRKVGISLPPQTNSEVEIFLPLTLLTKKALEKIPYRDGVQEKPLGEVYVMFINSFDRYFDNDFRRKLGNMITKKQALWNNDGQLGCENYYFGSVPSDGDEIVDNFAIAVWSQAVNPPLNESEWKQWPQKILELRKLPREITLFWDDLYPKPSKDKLKSQWLER